MASVTHRMDQAIGYSLSPWGQVDLCLQVVDVLVSHKASFNQRGPGPDSQDGDSGIVLMQPWKEISWLNDKELHQVSNRGQLLAC